VIPDNPVTAALVILSAAVTGLAGLLSKVVRDLIKGDLVPIQTLRDERTRHAAEMGQAKEIISLERARGDLATKQLDDLALEQARTTVALLASIDRRAARAAADEEGVPRVADVPSAG
jgi:hypothetical protein